MARRKFPSARPISLALQAARIDALTNWTARSGGRVLVADGTVQPTELSGPYKVHITYRLPNQPAVSLVDPPLQHRNGDWPDHIYENRDLCLYRPKYRDWTPARILAETVVPWISEWLACYEVWLLTGEWLGGGEHPRAKAGKRKDHDLRDGSD